MSLTELERPRAAVTRAGMPALSLHVRGLAKAFGTHRVIERLDLDVPAGQFLAIVGRSGCGKSTLLRLLAGLEAPDSGSIRLGDAAARAAQVRLMFQEPRLLPWASIVDNVAVGLGKSRPGKAREAALAALADVGLAMRADDWPSVLSGGQKQRVALARALVSGPSVMALDEPLGALDALTRVEMQDLVERVFRRQGFTAVLVTHDVSEAVALADRIIMLEAGRIALDEAVPAARPRRRGDPDAIDLEQRILDRLLKPRS